MKHAGLLGGIGIVMLVMVSSFAFGQSKHLAEAIEHAQAAVAQGRQGYPDALTTQAQEALKHAELAKKESPNPHLEEGIRGLKEAMAHGRAGHTDKATQAAADALTHLSATNPVANPADAMGDY